MTTIAIIIAIACVVGFAVGAARILRGPAAKLVVVIGEQLEHVDRVERGVRVFRDLAQHRFARVVEPHEATAAIPAQDGLGCGAVIQRDEAVGNCLGGVAGLEGHERHTCVRSEGHWVTFYSRCRSGGSGCLSHDVFEG